MSVLLKALLFLILQFKYSLAIASCVPCICLRSYGARKADCSRKIVNFTMDNIPDFINSDIQILNMTQHNLVTLKNETFVNVNLTELTSLYLDRCNIKKIETDAFKDLTYLTDLSLMYNDIHELESGLFVTNVFLKYLWIENNKIKHLPNGLFNKLENFQGLFARFNEISNVDDNLFINNEYLWIIDLSNNKLSYLNSQLITKTKISIIFMQENPFICDCQLKDLHETMKARNLYNETQPTCAFPNKLKGKEISALNSSDFKCWLNTTINPNTDMQIYDNINLTIKCINNALPKPETKLLSYNGEIIEPSYYYQKDTEYFFNFSITNLAANKSGLYKCISSNKIYNSSSENINITIIKTEKPNIVMYHPLIMTFHREMYNLTLSCQYTGIPKPFAFWKYNDTKITPSSINNIKYSTQTNKYWINLTISVLNYNNKGNYSCIVGNSLQSIQQNIVINVAPIFAPRITLLAERSVEKGSNFTLSCYIETYSKPSVISWKLNNKTLTSNNTIHQSLWNNLTIYNATIKDKGMYECAASTKETYKSAYHYLNILIKYLEIKMNSKHENENIIIYCQIKGYPKPLIEWIYENETTTITIKNISNKYSIKLSQTHNESYWSNLTVYNVTYNDNGKYYCVANNSEKSVNKYIVIDETCTYIYWYIGLVLFTFILAICIIKICLKCNKQSEANIKTDFSEYKITNDNKITAEIPMIEYSDEDTKAKPNEADIMYILDRELTTYNLMEQK